MERRPPEPPDRYLVAWADLRRRRWHQALAVPAVSMSSSVCIMIHAGWGRSLAALMLATLVAGVLVARFLSFRCPRCHERFEPSTFRPRGTGVCSSCGLVKGVSKKEADLVRELARLRLDPTSGDPLFESAEEAVEQRPSGPQAGRRP